jgi:TPR repeat protein
MNARKWFQEALETSWKADAAKNAKDRDRLGRSAIDAMFVAASLGHPDAFLELGLYYQYGKLGILRARMDLAEHWLKLAVAANSDGAMLALGTLLKRIGRPEEGRRWLRKALAHGDGGAACHLGREIEDEHPARALRLYLKGAALGDPIAALFAAEVIEKRGTKRDLLQAESLLKRSIRGGATFAEGDLERVRLKLAAMRSQKPGPTRKRSRS